VKVFDGHPTDEIFSHTDLQGVTRHWNTSAMVRAVFQRRVKPSLVNCPLTEDLIQHIEQNHGVEEPNIAQLPDKVLEIPVVLVHFDDGSDLLVDGNHRVVKRWRKGLRDVNAMLFQPKDWEPFLLTDIDHEYGVNDAGEFLKKLMEKPQ
jgi:hypothetical protein